MNISVDWDFFFEECPKGAYYSDYHCETVWNSRRIPKLRQDPHKFWKILDKCLILSNCRALICENHALAARWFPADEHILSFDYHTDDFQFPFDEYITPNNWAYSRNVTHITQPFHKLSIKSKCVNLLFICKSSPWTHPHYDRDFRKFCKRAPGVKHMEKGVSRTRRGEEHSPPIDPLMSIRASSYHTSDQLVIDLRKGGLLVL